MRHLRGAYSIETMSFDAATSEHRDDDEELQALARACGVRERRPANAESHVPWILGLLMGCCGIAVSVLAVAIYVLVLLNGELMRLVAGATR